MHCWQRKPRATRRWNWGGVNKILESAGFRTPIEPTASGYEFYWITKDNRVVLVEMNDETPRAIVYPETFVEKYRTNLPTEWYSLKGEPCKHENTHYEVLYLIGSETETYYHKLVCGDCGQVIDWEIHDKTGPEGTCSKCGYRLTIVIPEDCNHMTGNAYDLSFVPIALQSGGSDYHMVICNICNEVITEKALHRYDNDGQCVDCLFKPAIGGGEECSHAMLIFTPNEDGTHTKTCGTCGESWEEDCVYVYIVDRKTGTSSIECLYCKDKYPVSEHTHDFKYSSNGNGSHNRVCNDANCDDKAAANVENILCSYSEIRSDESGKKYRECIYCGYRKEELKQGLVDGFYYKDDRLFTGEEDGHNFEYGKLVIETEATEVGSWIDYEWKFILTGIDPKYITDDIVLKFIDMDTDMYPGLFINNHIKLEGFGDYKATAVDVAPAVNIAAAMEMLQEAVDSGKTDGILSLIERVFDIDQSFYPYATESKQYKSWNKSGSFTEYLKGLYGVGHLYELLTEDHWVDLIGSPAFMGYPAWPSGITQNGLFVGTILDGSTKAGYFGNYAVMEPSNSNRIRIIDPEYILLFWKVGYNHVYWDGITNNAQGAYALLYSAAYGSSYNGINFYKYDTMNWKADLSNASGCDIYSDADLYEGVSLSAFADFYIFYGMHGYLGGNTYQSASYPHRSFRITVTKRG